MRSLIKINTANHFTSETQEHRGKIDLGINNNYNIDIT